MSGCRLTALLVFLFILTGGSLGFTVVPENSNLNVGVGRDAIFTVRPSAAIASGSWVFKGITIISWIETASSIPVDYSSRVNVNFTTGTLALETVTERDSGDYIVTVTSQGVANQDTATIKLLALEVIDNPTITANDSSPVEFLDAVLLTCDVTWKADRFEWYQWNKTIGLIDRAALGLGNKTLTVSGVLRSDEGFTCLASNVNNTRTSDPYDLGAVYGPDSVSVTVSPEHTMHAIGASVTFTCSVVANHPLDFHWYHGNSTVQSGGQKLTVAPLFLNHTGNYTCSASSGRTRKDGLASRSIVVIEPVSQPVVSTNDTRPVEHNDTVVLQCFALGTSVSYQWSRNGATISPGGRLVLNNDNRTLTISGVLRTDQEFTCTGYNLVSTNTSNPLLLNVSYGPENLKISVIPEKTAHTTGSEASLTCSAVSNPAAEYQWLFNGLYQASGQQLVLAPLDTNDAGSYTCQVFNNETQRSSATTRNIAVIEPVSTPNITANSSSFIEYNDTVVLTCLATGTDVSYTWIGNGSAIANGGRLELSAGNSTLNITGVLRSDGPFTCRASNPVSTETSQPFHLNVFYGPDLPIIIPDPNATLYNSGTEVTLTCSAESEPTAQLEWFLQGDLVQSGAQLTFPNVSADNSGSYLCSAFNNVTGRFHASSIQINVEEPVADVQLHSNRSPAVENQHSVLLTCSSNGTHLRWEWLLNKQPVQQNDRINISRDTLLIDPVNRSDAGTYKCIVSNGLNSGSAETTLQVHYGPDNMKITPTSPVNIEVGEDLTLTCSAQSEPSPTYIWSKGTVRLSEGPELTNSSVSKEDSGNYTCHVSNAELRTNNSLTAQVIVQGVQDASLSAGAIVGIAIAGIVAVAGITGGIVWLVRAKMNRLKSGSSNGDCKMSPRGNIPMLQTEYAAIGRKLPGPQQLGPSNNGTVASPAQTREGDVIYISPHIINPSMNPIGEVFIDNKTDYAELKHR